LLGWDNVIGLAQQAAACSQIRFDIFGGFTTRARSNADAIRQAVAATLKPIPRRLRVRSTNALYAVSEDFVNLLFSYAAHLANRVTLDD
jgi:hypothetical protein